MLCVHFPVFPLLLSVRFTYLSISNSSIACAPGCPMPCPRMHKSTSPDSYLLTPCVPRARRKPRCSTYPSFHWVTFPVFYTDFED
ncbi:hypothetical protein F5B22DRAFT_628136 [Xylaria bambusicola]|uniref:uncharacterized protein n=1 Tax=Xylaria bambusicola TaxID=326684 RepID=UPI00200880CD|nr:uncharacterized protein F5B22DRAFT_628136 [Xylaria bambusicola]KAI0505300.1 hypothetical protein F5B22DRAFT_628136 [Xylaria bambusicola]